MSTTSQSNTTTILVLSASILVLSAVYYKNRCMEDSSPVVVQTTTPIVVQASKPQSFLYKSGRDDSRRKRFLQRYNPYDFLMSSRNYRNYRKENFTPDYDLATQTLSNHPLTIQYSPITFSKSDPHGLRAYSNHKQTFHH